MKSISVIVQDESVLELTLKSLLEMYDQCIHVKLRVLVSVVDEKMKEKYWPFVYIEEIQPFHLALLKRKQSLREKSKSFFFSLIKGRMTGKNALLVERNGEVIFLWQQTFQGENLAKKKNLQKCLKT